MRWTFTGKTPHVLHWLGSYCLFCELCSGPLPLAQGLGFGGGYLLFALGIKHWPWIISLFLLISNVWLFVIVLVSFGLWSCISGPIALRSFAVWSFVVDRLS